MGGRLFMDKGFIFANVSGVKKVSLTAVNMVVHSHTKS